MAEAGIFGAVEKHISGGDLPVVADFKGDAVCLAFGRKGFLTVFDNIRKELQVEIEIGEKSAVDSDYALVKIPGHQTIAVFDVRWIIRINRKKEPWFYGNLTTNRGPFKTFCKVEPISLVAVITGGIKNANIKIYNEKVK